MNPATATTLLQLGLLLALAVGGQLVAVHHLAEDEIPRVLRSRVALSNRVRPWVAGFAAALVGSGAALLVWPV